jgi:(R)-citramalyl-CoA lyase
MKQKITIVDVAPRDGLQTELKILSLSTRVELVNRIAQAGMPRIEIGSFVNPEQVPQMAGMQVLCEQLKVSETDGYTALVPNLKGYESASKAGLRHVRLAILASDSLNKANFHCTTEASFENFKTIAQKAASEGIAFGSIIGASFGCPYEGAVPSKRVLDLSRRIAALGADEIVLADTTGMAVPDQVAALCSMLSETLANTYPKTTLGVHLHNTRNTGYANAYAAVKAGITCFDSSLGGIGGCPFAPHAVGNIATEDLVHMLNGLGYASAVDLNALIHASAWLSKQLGKALPALLGKVEPVYLKPITRSWRE